MEAPLTILGTLAKRVVDEALYSLVGNPRGVDPDSSADTKGFVDGIGILPAQQAEILEAIDINRLAGSPGQPANGAIKTEVPQQDRYGPSTPTAVPVVYNRPRCTNRRY